MPRFHFLNGRTFDIPDACWSVASNFVPSSPAYKFDRRFDAPLVRVDAIDPPSSEGRLILGPGGLDQARMRSVLTAIASGMELPPVTVTEIANGYDLLEGFHRLHASLALGFSHIPACVR